MKRQVPVTLCASPDPAAVAPTCSQDGSGANGGFIVWVDENGNVDRDGRSDITDGTDGNAVVDMGEQILIRTAAPGAPINVLADSGYIAYGANGFRRQATGAPNPSATRILFCDDRGNRATSVSCRRHARCEST